jgi:hypothetical protein
MLSSKVPTLYTVSRLVTLNDNLAWNALSLQRLLAFVGRLDTFLVITIHSDDNLKGGQIFGVCLPKIYHGTYGVWTP